MMLEWEFGNVLQALRLPIRHKSSLLFRQCLLDFKPEDNVGCPNRTRRYVVDTRQLNSSEPLWRTQLLDTHL